MHDIRWTARKIAQRIALVDSWVYRDRSPLPAFHYTELMDPMDEPPVGADVDYSVWETVSPNSYWSRQDTNFVLRTTFEIPVAWDNEAPLALYLPLGDVGSFSHPEALVYIDGVAYATCDRHHQEILLRRRWQDGETYQLALHGWSGNQHPQGEIGRFLMRTCYIVQIDQPTRDFVILARNALEVANTVDANDPVRSHLLNALDDAFKQVDLREPIGDAFYQSIGQAMQTLQVGVQNAGPALDVHITATGHAHIDVAWLWTLGQTRLKAGRTFYNVMRFMEQFPHYRFNQSTAQLYDYVRQDYPTLFEAIKDRVAEDRWEVIGGMWVEADCNLSGPESLARQFLLGTSFFRKHFGDNVMTPVLWLPDVFGYAWNLPQLIKEAGLEYFFTIKIGWSQYNRLPYDTFWWQGLDGTQVLTHFSTTPESHNLEARATYNAYPTPGTAIGTWRRFQQKDESHDVLMVYGYGDGGGGPTREMLENIQVMGELPGVPHVQSGKVRDFFTQVEADSGEKLPVWNGELYLELHRGTYTTQSRNKRANRQSEFLLHDAEALAVLAKLLDSSYTYPAETFQKAWELVCLNQFHDIIPGSSITAVYRESLQQYAEVRTMTEQARDAALQAIAGKHNGHVLIVNPTSFARTDLAFWPHHLAEGKRFERIGGVITQKTTDGTWIGVGEIAPYSVVALSVVDGEPVTPETSLHIAPDILKNDYVRVEINAGGDITRIYDRLYEREVMPPDTLSNQFLAFEDRPLNWDAWDVDIFYDDKVYFAEPAESIRVIESGPLRGTVEIKRRILNSSYVQRISLSYNSPRIDFDTEIDWHEKHILLKAAFPVDVLSPHATYEIQWGNVERPTHRNTSWDWARFEMAAQKWVDLSEGDYGVSLLNDSKYGHAIHDNVIQISLLRGPIQPDPQADQGHHRFAYSLLPHTGSWGRRTIAHAYALNDSLLAVTGTVGEAVARPAEGLLSVDGENVVIETVKWAEDGDGIIIRLYECMRRRGTTTLRTGFPLADAQRTNLVEEYQYALEVTDNTVTFDIHPYQIVTLRLRPA